MKTINSDRFHFDSSKKLFTAEASTCGVNGARAFNIKSVKTGEWVTFRLAGRETRGNEVLAWEYRSTTGLMAKIWND